VTKIERFKKGNFLLILMKKSYTLSKYGRDKRLVQAVEEMGFDNLDVYHKIDLLKVFGYENLKGGLYECCRRKKSKIQEMAYIYLMTN